MRILFFRFSLYPSVKNFANSIWLSQKKKKKKKKKKKLYIPNKYEYTYKCIIFIRRQPRKNNQTKKHSINLKI